MGSGLFKGVGDQIEDTLIAQRLLTLKQIKRQRDLTLASTIARSRDLMHWTGAMNITIISANLFKMVVLRSGPVPISVVPMLFGPFAFFYNVDLAYGQKMERLNNETIKIIRQEKHWFNEPMVLPMYLEPTYQTMQVGKREGGRHPTLALDGPPRFHTCC